MGSADKLIEPTLDESGPTGSPSLSLISSVKPFLSQDGGAAEGAEEGDDGRKSRTQVMVVRIRLARFGCRNRPFYRVMAADSRSPRDGKHLEVLGYYNPLPGESLFSQIRVRLICFASV